MFSLPPQDILDLLFQQKTSRNPKVREEVVNRVTAALLTFPRHEFKLQSIAFEVSKFLVDNRRIVRLAALECMAVFAQLFGTKLSSLMSIVEAIETQRRSECEGLVSLDLF